MTYGTDESRLAESRCAYIARATTGENAVTEDVAWAALGLNPGHRSEMVKTIRHRLRKWYR